MVILRVELEQFQNGQLFRAILILNFAVGGIYPFKINGLKKPYYGLSEKALQLIKNQKAKMMVDWVKVTAY